MLSKLIWIGLLGAQGIFGKPQSKMNLPDFTDLDIASGKALATLNKLALEGAEKKYGTKCSKNNVKVRKEW